LVLSHRLYNERSKLALMCPITRQAKGYGFEVPLPPGIGVDGVVLADHVRSLSWFGRNARFIGRAPSSLVNVIVVRVRALMESR
jgi:mRNA interferase MazF